MAEARQPPERLFRDDAGAAIERAHRLEQENQALRAEIEKIKEARPAPVPAPYRVGTIALCIATIAVGATMTFSSMAEPETIAVPQVLYASQPAYAPPPAPPPIDPASCSIPYWYDAQNVKHYKPSCLRR